MKYKKIIFLLVLISFSMPLLAQRNKRKSSNSGPSIRTSTSRTLTSNSSSLKEEKDEATKIDLTKYNNETITKYNTQKLYTKCMDTICFDPKTGRCPCKVEEKFITANEKCEYIINNTPSQKIDITTFYKRNSDNDCRDVVLNNNEVSGKNIYNYLAELITCMKPKCRLKSQGDFTGCFDDDKIISRLEMCKSVYSDYKNPAEVEAEFKKSLISYKTKYCNDILGTMTPDGNCNITIGIGPSRKEINATKQFTIGDKVICSPEAFNTSLTANEVKKLGHVKNIVKGTLSLTSQGLSLAGSIVGSKKEITETKEGVETVKVDGGLEYEEKVDIIKGSGEYKHKVNAVDVIVAGMGAIQSSAGMVTDIISLSKNEFSFPGKCFIIKGNNAKEIFQEHPDFEYEIKWSDEWANMEK